MTEKVRKRIRSRPGNGAPSSVASGNASAAARETAPRIPAHDTNTAPRQLDMRPAIHFGAWRTTNTHAKRSAITVPLTSAAQPRSAVENRERVDDDRELEADEHEQERIQRVLDDLPHRDPLQPNLGGGEACASPGRRRRDRSENVETPISPRNEGDVPAQQRERDLRGWIVEPAANLCQPTASPKAMPPPATTTNSPPSTTPRTTRR